MTIHLDKWQKQVLDTKGNIVLRSGRQVGKSTVISHYAGDYAAKNPKKTILIIAAVERQAFLLFEKVLNFMENNHSRLIRQGKNRPTKSRIRLTNGSIIYCLPTGLSGTNIRGYTIDMLIADEAAFIPEAVWNAVTPMMSTRVKFGARMILLSTPFGRHNYFARCFNDDTFTKFHVSSEECERISKDFLKQEKERMTKIQYSQEYLGEFVDDLMQFFPDEVILKCMKLKRPNHITAGKPYFLGVDIARMGDDESTFEVIRLTDNKHLIHVENQITTKKYLSQTTEHIIELDKLYDFQKIFIDDEGIGVGVFDNLLTNDQTKRKVIPINNSKRVLDNEEKIKKVLLKTDLYNNLLTLMEQGKISLLDDPEIYQSLKSVQYEYTSDTLGRSHFKIYGNYTHITEGLIRAAWCLKYKGLNIWIDSF